MYDLVLLRLCKKPRSLIFFTFLEKGTIVKGNQRDRIYVLFRPTSLIPTYLPYSDLPPARHKAHNFGKFRYKLIANDHLIDLCTFAQKYTFLRAVFRGFGECPDFYQTTLHHPRKSCITILGSTM